MPQLEKAVKVFSLSAETLRKPQRRERVSCVHPKSFPLTENRL